MEDQTEVLDIKSEIRQLYEADQKDRVDFSNDQTKSLEIHRAKGLEIRHRDDERLKQAKDIVARGSTSDPEELNMLSYIFQHGASVDDYKQALDLTTKAVELGLDPKISLIPQATDRLMVQEQLDRGVPLTQLKQKYGTQTRINEEGKPIKPILDGTATQEELEKFGILLV